jgi:predicted DNA-binding transcriptional regulator AlpA
VSQETRPPGMTVDQALALPVVMNVATGSAALGLSTSTGYDLARRGQFPVPIRKIGGRMKVFRADLFRYLGLVDGQDAERRTA